jgi:hypothetical protein
VSAAEIKYAQLTKAFLERANVTCEGKGFGSSALKVNGRIFVMLTPRGDFVAKLPRQRVDDLIAADAGLPYDAGKGRPMKEWVVIRPESQLEWASVAEEALAFVSGSPAAR